MHQVSLMPLARGKGMRGARRDKIPCHTAVGNIGYHYQGTYTCVYQTRIAWGQNMCTHHSLKLTLHERDLDTP